MTTIEISSKVTKEQKDYLRERGDLEVFDSSTLNISVPDEEADDLIEWLDVTFGEESWRLI